MKNIKFISAGAGSGKTYTLIDELYRAVTGLNPQNSKIKANEILLTTFTNKAADEIKIKARERLLGTGEVKSANDLQNAYIGTIHSVATLMIKKFWHFLGMPQQINIIADEDAKLFFRRAVASIPTNRELDELNKLNNRFDRRADKFYDPDKWQDDMFKVIELARTNKIADFTLSKNKSLEIAKELLETRKNLTVDYSVINIVIDDILRIGNELPEQDNKGRKDEIKKLNRINRDNIKYSDLTRIKNIITDLLAKELDEGLLNNAYFQLDTYSSSINILNDIERYNELIFDLASRCILTFREYKQEHGLIDYADMEALFLEMLDVEEIRQEISQTVKLVLVDEFQDSNPIQLEIFVKLSDIVEKSIWVGDPKQSIYAFRGTDPVLIDSIIEKFNDPSNETLSTDILNDSWRSRPDIVILVNEIFIDAFREYRQDDITGKEVQAGKYTVQELLGFPAGISAVALNPMRSEKGFEKVRALHHFNLVKQKSNKQDYYKGVANGVVKILQEKWPVNDKEKTEIYNNLEDDVVNRDLKGNDIAVLCRTRIDVATISEELKNRGVRVAAEVNGLEMTAEFQLVTALLRLVIQKNNSLAVAEIMVLTEDNATLDKVIDDRLEFLSRLPEYPIKPENTENITSEEKKVYNGKVEEFYNVLNSWGETNFLIKGLSKIVEKTMLLPVPEMTESLINRLNLYGVVDRWGNAVQRRSNLQKIIELAFKYDERCLNMNLGATVSGFLKYIEQGENSESISADKDAVNVLTYHAAKGLEWPVVILTGFDSDPLSRLLTNEVFGVKIHSDGKIDPAHILDNRFIKLVPWPFGASNAKLPDSLKNHITNTSYYKNAKNNILSEYKRLMYVGMTRARDYLVTTGRSEKNNYKWIDMVNKHDKWSFGKYADKADGLHNIFDRPTYSFTPKLMKWLERKKYSKNILWKGNDFQVHNLDVDDYLTLDTPENNTWFAGKSVTPASGKDSYFISPSKVISDREVKVGKVVDIYDRLNIKGTDEGYDILGNCLHDIFYYGIGRLTEGKAIEEGQLMAMLVNYEITPAVKITEVISSIKKFYEWANKTFKPLKWYREIPIEVEINGQLYRGESDLLLETGDGFVLIDYKSYPGAVSNVLDPKSDKYAGKYAGQLDTYANMIQKTTEKEVLKKLIFYTVLGNIVELD